GRELAQPGEQLALELDRLDERAAVGERMRAPRLREAAHERRRRRVEKDRLHADAFALQIREERQQVRQRSGAADIDGHCDAALAALCFEADEVAQQLGREVVHTEDAGIFERMQRDGLAGPRNAGDENDLSWGGIATHDAAFRVGRFAGALSSAPDASISCACARLVDESFSPPSMRAISATRASPATPSTALVAAPSACFLRTTKWWSAHAATCGRCVTAKTWRPLPSCFINRPTVSATAPPMPASTSSKISVAGACSPCGSMPTTATASAMRDSSPPEAT